MRVKKNSDGTYTVEDEPMRLEGEAADRFLADMQRREAAGDTAQRKRFLEECDRTYAAGQIKRQNG